jgi:RluA family pseudouridine synthase
MAGAVRMDGAAPRRPDVAVRAGRRVEAWLREDAARGPSGGRTPVLDASRILFEDAWLLAVDKPAGLPTHETADPARPHLVGLLRRFLEGRAGAGDGAPRLGVHQRLDRDTSGVILFTRDPAADAGLSRQFTSRSVQKTYHALTRPGPRALPARWTVSGGLAPNDDGPSEETTTEFCRLAAFPRAVLVEARPRTGRKHQVRVHLARSGLPILGDDRYGRPDPQGPVAPRLMLHATRLAVLHPVTGASLVIESPWPADFRGMVEALRARGRARGRRRRR